MTGKKALLPLRKANLRVEGKLAKEIMALGDSRHAIFFSLFRKAVIVAPLTVLLPKLGFGVDGVFLAEPISNAIGGLACFVTIYVTLYRKLKQDESLT